VQDVLHFLLHCLGFFSINGLLCTIHPSV
jgi:hypothetical protein